MEKAEQGKQVLQDTPVGSPDAADDLAENGEKAVSSTKAPQAANKQNRTNYDMAAQDLQRPEVPPAPPSLLAVPSGMEDATGYSQANGRSGQREFQNRTNYD